MSPTLTLCVSGFSKEINSAYIKRSNTQIEDTPRGANVGPQTRWGLEEVWRPLLGCRTSSLGPDHSGWCRVPSYEYEAAKS